MNIINVVDQVWPGRPRPRSIERIDTIAIHRCGVDKQYGIDLGFDAEAICAHFTGRDKTYPEIARATGGRIAYTLLVGAKGELWQCMPLDETGMHAAVWNARALGVAMVGDFRYDPPSEAQWSAAVEVVAHLSLALGVATERILGHDELPGGRADARKACPGYHWEMDIFRVEVEQIRRSMAVQQLMESGWA